MAKSLINPIILKYNFNPLLRNWNNSSVPLSLNIIKDNFNTDGWKCKSNKFVGFYGVTKTDAIYYLRNSYPELRELESLTKNIENHTNIERFTDAYIQIFDNPLRINLWEYYPGTMFSQDELNGYSLIIQKKY